MCDAHGRPTSFAGGSGVLVEGFSPGHLLESLGQLVAGVELSVGAMLFAELAAIAMEFPTVFAPPRGAGRDNNRTLSARPRNFGSSSVTARRSSSSRRTAPVACAAAPTA